MTHSHLAGNPGPLGLYSDAARRLSDTVTMHLTAIGSVAAGRWIAARLSDGGTDNVLYDTKADAVRHQLHEFQCAYVCITPDGMGYREAEIYLAFNRKLYENGYRMPDPSHHVTLPMNAKLKDFR